MHTDIGAETGTADVVEVTLRAGTVTTVNAPESLMGMARLSPGSGTVRGHRLQIVRVTVVEG